MAAAGNREIQPRHGPMNTSDHRFMARALRLAREGLYSAHPNPRVGCVVVRGDTIVGEGWHRRAGEPHAEVLALSAAGAAAAGSSVYVNLEPCCHHGRTGPCTRRLIEAGVRRVVAAMLDPNPVVAGQGMAELERAGIEVATGLLEAPARALNCGFVARMTRRQPFVRAKLAASLDGRTALRSGESRWITGEAARRDVHRLRARSSAIVTGVETVLADDPSLTVRLDPPEGAGSWAPAPLRVIVDSRLRTPTASRMLTLPGETIVATTSTDSAAGALLEEAGAEIVRLPARDAGVDLVALLDALAERRCNEVMLECGARLNGAFLESRLVDELIVYLAPSLLGDSARGMATLPGIQRMADRLELEIRDVCAVGSDWRIVARPRNSACGLVSDLGLGDDSAQPGARP